MRKISFAIVCLGVVLGLPAPAQAQNIRTYVSGNGNGTACSFSAPCNDFGTAMAATVPGGIVSCVDQGGNSTVGVFYAITITKSITIDCAGTSAAAFFVTINGPGIVVTLRNLQINAGGSSFSTGLGIDFQEGSALFVEHCVIENWNTGIGAGIHFAPTTATGTAELHVTDSVIKNNGNRLAGSGAGIYIAPATGAGARVAIERTVIENNSNGIFAGGSGGMALVEVSNSMIANNATNGVWASTTGSTASVVLDGSKLVSNGVNGANAQGNGAYVSLNNTTVVWNGTGLTTSSGGAILSYKNNVIGGNPNPGVTPISFPPQ